MGRASYAGHVDFVTGGGREPRIYESRVAP